MARVPFAPLALSTLLGLAAFAPRARACGGCFAPPSPDVSLVTGHRMAFAISETRTVLWDQFEYSGNPEDFSWVLPIVPGAYVEESTDAWFEALDAFTSVRVVPPQLNCAQGSFSESGCGCGSSASSESASAGSGGATNQGGVSVLHHGTVGPYETTTLSSTDPQALRSWLTSRGYAIPVEIEPIIDAYVAEGFDFVALRLSPGQGVQQMTPVRVVTPGGPSELPLRMVAAGVGSFVGITLFVIAETRHFLPDLPEVSVSGNEIEWNFASGTSNYGKLRDATLAKNSSRSFLTPFARQNAFSRQIERPDGFGTATFTPAGSTGFEQFTTLAELYFAQAAVNDAQLVPSCAGVVSALEWPNLVQEGQTTQLECAGYTDVAAAMIGMRPQNVWLTRLEMNLPSTALDHDCVVKPAVSQAQIENWHVAKKLENPPCDEPVFSGQSAPAGVPLLWLGALSGALVGRRAARRRGGR